MPSSSGHPQWAGPGWYSEGGEGCSTFGDAVKVNREICWCWHGVRRTKSSQVRRQLFWPQHLEEQSCADWDEESCEKALQGRSGTSSCMLGGSQRCPSDCLEMLPNASPALLLKNRRLREFPGGQWLGLCPFAAKGMGSTSGQKTKIPKLCSHKKNKEMFKRETNLSRKGSCL